MKKHMLQTCIRKPFAVKVRQMNYSFASCMILTLLVSLGGIGGVSGSPSDNASCEELQFTGLSFSPYLHGKNPDRGDTVSEEEIESLLRVIQPHTTWIRTYGTEKGLENAGRIAHSLNMSVMMGAWIDDNKRVNENQLNNLIAAAKAGDVDIAAIGNEMLHRGTVSDDELISYIKRFKEEVPDVPVTCVDTYDEMIEHPKIIDAVDVVAVNIFPYWEGVSITDALDVTKDRYEKVKKAANGKEVIIGEMGWPSAGSATGAALPSYINANWYLKESTSWAEQNGIQYFYLEAYNQPWKQESGVGPYWGVWDENEQMKYEC